MERRILRTGGKGEKKEPTNGRTRENREKGREIEGKGDDWEERRNMRQKKGNKGNGGGNRQRGDERRDEKGIR